MLFLKLDSTGMNIEQSENSIRFGLKSICRRVSSTLKLLVNC